MAAEPKELTEAAIWQMRQAIEAAAIPGLVSVVQGWPDEDDLAEFPAVSLMPGREDWTHIWPEPLEEVSNGDGTVDTIYRTNHLSLQVQMDVWTGGERGKTERFNLLPKLLELFGAKIDADANGVLQVTPAGLELTLEHHLDAPARVHLSRGSNKDKEENSVGQFRKTYPLELHTEQRKALTAPEASFTSANTFTTD